MKLPLFGVSKRRLNMTNVLCGLYIRCTLSTISLSSSELASNSGFGRAPSTSTLFSLLKSLRGFEEVIGNILDLS